MEQFHLSAMPPIRKWCSLLKNKSKTFDTNQILGEFGKGAEEESKHKMFHFASPICTGAMPSNYESSKSIYNSYQIGMSFGWCFLSKLNRSKRTQKMEHNVSLEVLLGLHLSLDRSMRPFHLLTGISTQIQGFAIYIHFELNFRAFDLCDIWWKALQRHSNS